MRKIIPLLLLLITFFVLPHTADAASVIEKNGPFGEPKIQNGKVRVDVSGAKYLRHAKYADSSQTNVVQVAQVSKSNLTGFAYSCPGYYLTRAYSDSAGTKLIGYIRVQVVSSDVTTKGCPAVSEKPTTTAPPATKVNKTHPVPEVSEPKNMIGDSDGGGSTPAPSDPYKDPVYLDAKQQCDLHNRNGATMWEIRWNPNTYEAKCVDMSDCMYTTLWYCTAPTTPPNNNVPEEEEVPSREQYSVTNSEDFGECGIGDTIEDRTVTLQCVAEEGGATSPPDEDGGEEGGAEGCEICKIFECPGWEVYLGTLYQVANYAIGEVEAPPVPDLPRPSMPNIFDISNDVDQRNPTKPTGSDGVGDAGFDAAGIKSQAPEIPVREDPTGGFNIVDPLSTLPEDGSTAPRPQEELETLPYPGGGGGGSSGAPKPSDNDNHSSSVPMPDNPGGTAKPSDTGGTAVFPIP